MAEVAADQIGSPEQALDALGRALKEEPMPGAALDDLERIAGAAKLPAAGAAKIEAAIADADPDSARELALRAARLYVEARDAAAAERLYQKVLEGDEENVDALQALEGLYRDGGRRAAAGGDPDQARRGRAGSPGAADAADGGRAAARAAAAPRASATRSRRCRSCAPRTRATRRRWPS